MLRSTRFFIFFGMVWCLAAGSPLMAQQWARAMFSETSHDFGTIARGAKAEFAFTFKNIYVEDVRIKKVQTSCGCTGVNYSTEAIKTHQESQIIATVDTRSFIGRKGATIRVEFDKPYPAIVLLNVHSYIRRDVVFEPGLIQFGTVKQGETVRRKTTVKYAGRPDWAITSISSPSDFITTKFSKVVSSGGTVVYDLWATLKPDAPPGYLSGHLIIHTNDPNPQTSQVPLAVEGVVESELQVRPTSLTLLACQNGKMLQRNVVVQAAHPFRVTDIQSSDSRIKCRIPDKESKFQVIRVSFKPGAKIGKFNARLKIHTNLNGGRYVALGIHGEVVDEKPQGS